MTKKGETNHSFFHTCIILIQVIVSANHIKCDRIHVVSGVAVIKWFEIKTAVSRPVSIWYLNYVQPVPPPYLSRQWGWGWVLAGAGRFLIWYTPWTTDKVQICDSFYRKCPVLALTRDEGNVWACGKTEKQHPPNTEEECMVNDLWVICCSPWTLLSANVTTRADAHNQSIVGAKH